MSTALDHALHLTLTVKSEKEAANLIWHMHNRMAGLSPVEQKTLRHYQDYLRNYIRSSHHALTQ